MLAAHIRPPSTALPLAADHLGTVAGDGSYGPYLVDGLSPRAMPPRSTSRPRSPSTATAISTSPTAPCTPSGSSPPPPPRCSAGPAQAGDMYTGGRRRVDRPAPRCHDLDPDPAAAIRPGSTLSPWRRAWPTPTVRRRGPGAAGRRLTGAASADRQREARTCPRPRRRSTSPGPAAHHLDAAACATGTPPSVRPGSRRTGSRHGPGIGRDGDRQARPAPRTARPPRTRPAGVGNVPAAWVESRRRGVTVDQRRRTARRGDRRARARAVPPAWPPGPRSPTRGTCCRRSGRSVSTSSQVNVPPDFDDGGPARERGVGEDVGPCRRRAGRRAGPAAAPSRGPGPTGCPSEAT